MEIKHDFHIHTDRSICAERDAYAIEYIKAAKEIGLKKIGFADHFWDDSYTPLNTGFYAPQNFAHVSTILDDIKNADTQGLEVYFGCEAEYSIKHGVGITEECAEKFDFIIVPNSHTHMTMPKEYYRAGNEALHLEFMIQAYYDILNSPVSRYILSMAHPFEAVACPYDNNILKKMITDDTFKRVFDATAEKNIAVEINTACFIKHTPQTIVNTDDFRMFNIAKECGCRFTFGSDAHKIPYFRNNYLDICKMMVEALNLKESDLADFVK